MMKPRFVCTLVVLLQLTSVNVAQACSVFVLEGTQFAMVGRNYDWETGTGMVIVNKRGMSKVALGLNNPMKWVSKYGSVSFNQYGRGFPCGGMNEAGLVIEVLWLDETQYPKPDERPMVSTLQWIQYQLDTAATVKEVVASDKRLRIETFSGTRVHFFVAQRSGQVATIEFLGGKLVAHQGAEMPVQALTNSTYARSLLRVDKKRLSADDPPVCDGSSLSRFVCAGTMASQFSRVGAEQGQVDYCFDVLRRVRQGSYTKWSIVYDTDNYRIHFKTRKANQLRFVDLKALDLDNDTPVLTLDLDEDISGDVLGELRPYTYEQNREVFARSLKETPVFSALPSFVFDAVAKYPESTKPVAKSELVSDPQTQPSRSQPAAIP
jgi:penicillin V acylase-like amidase (Ntn superfamily)